MALAFRPKKHPWAAASVVCSVLVLACEPNLVVGKWTSPSGAQAGSNAEAGSNVGGGGGIGAEAGIGAQAGVPTDAGAGGDNDPGPGSTCDGAAGESAIPRIDDPVAVPWSTGFEDGICGYRNAGGFCYAKEDASYEIVSTPVHSGESAAAFSVANGTFDGMQARCVRQGTLPNVAYYSAFFFIPSAPTAANNWNLIHFRGGERPSARLHGLWDVSLARQPDGTYQVYVFDFLRTMTRSATNVPPVPIGSWFQLEVYLKRATGPTGAFEVRQDGRLAVSLSGLSTDDTTFGQWYVGNLANSLTPPESVVYVDDVSIREVPSF
jgi:hypothetical protein